MDIMKDGHLCKFDDIDGCMVPIGEPVSREPITYIRYVGECPECGKEMALKREPSPDGWVRFNCYECVEFFFAEFQ